MPSIPPAPSRDRKRHALAMRRNNRGPVNRSTLGAPSSKLPLRTVGEDLDRLPQGGEFAGKAAHQAFDSLRGPADSIA